MIICFIEREGQTRDVNLQEFVHRFPSVVSPEHEEQKAGYERFTKLWKGFFTATKTLARHSTYQCSSGTTLLLSYGPLARPQKYIVQVEVSHKSLHRLPLLS